MWTKGKVVYSVCFPFGEMAGLAEGKCSHLCYSLTVIWAQKSTHKIQGLLLKKNTKKRRKSLDCLTQFLYIKI